MESQINFLNGPKNEKYKRWAIGTSWAYHAYNELLIDEIIEITCWHLRLIIGQHKFDFYPMGKKIMNKKNNKWSEISSEQHLRNYIKSTTL